MNYWADYLTYTPCEEAFTWLRTQPDAQTAWDKSERGDWMLYHAGKLAGEPGSDARRPLVLAACACARLALPFVRKGELRPLKAIETAERWARGEANAPSLEEVRRAATAVADYAAAYAADTDAAYAAYTTAAIANATDAAFAACAAVAIADATAVSAFAAVSAYAAVSAAYATRAKTLAACADIVRKHYPKVPT